jgi:hypothetical protein
MSDDPIKRLSDLVEMQPEERIKNELRMLDGLLGAAVKDKDWGGALKIMTTANDLLKAFDREKRTRR